MTTWRISLREFPRVYVDVEHPSDIYARPAFDIARPMLERGLLEKLRETDPEAERQVLSFADCNFRKLGQPKAKGAAA